jgi:hypothetical protein
MGELMDVLAPALSSTSRARWPDTTGAFAGVRQNRVTREAGLTRAEPVGDTLIFLGVARDGSMCWRSGEAAGE